MDFAGLSKVTFPSAGTVTKLGIWLDFVNASSPLKIAIFNSSRVVVGSAITNTIASGDAQWHEWTTSITIPSSGTYYIGFSQNGPYAGSLVTRQRSGTSGDSYFTFDATAYTDFPAPAGLSIGSDSLAVRAEFTP